jgi:hypothetical protein
MGFYSFLRFLRHDFCSIVSNERLIMLLRHAQPRKPKNEALIYSLLLYIEVRYSRGPVTADTCGSIVQGSVWGLGMGRPFPNAQAWGRHCADNNTGAQRYLFRVVQISGDCGTQLLRAAAPMSKILGP